MAKYASIDIATCNETLLMLRYRCTFIKRLAWRCVPLNHGACTLPSIPPAAGQQPHYPHQPALGLPVLGRAREVNLAFEVASPSRATERWPSASVSTYSIGLPPTHVGRPSAS